MKKQAPEIFQAVAAASTALGFVPMKPRIGIRRCWQMPVFTPHGYMSVHLFPQHKNGEHNLLRFHMMEARHACDVTIPVSGDIEGAMQQAYAFAIQSIREYEIAGKRRNKWEKLVTEACEILDSQKIPHGIVVAYMDGTVEFADGNGRRYRMTPELMRKVNFRQAGSA